MTHLESKEIKGMTWKLLIIIISQTIIVTSTAILFFARLDKKMQIIIDEQERFEQVTNEKFSNQGKDIDINRKNIEGFEYRYNELLLNTHLKK